MTSRRRRIVEVFRDRLEAIRKANGYLTNAGEQIFLGEAVTMGPDDPKQAIAIVVEEDVPTPTGQGLGAGADAAVEIRLPVSVHAIVKADLETPLLSIEDVIHDIKRAVELPDRTLGDLARGIRRGPIRPLERQAGSTIAGAAVEYELLYSEAWGDPEA